MTKYVYGAVIKPSEDGGYWAEVPDLEGCYGQGKTFIDTVESISDGVETHLAALVDYGMEIPQATRVEVDEGEVVYIYANIDGSILGEPAVSASEAARRLDVSPGRVSQLISAGKLKAERTADGTSVTIASIEEYANSGRTAGRPRKKEA